MLTFEKVQEIFNLIEKSKLDKLRKSLFESAFRYV